MVAMVYRMMVMVVVNGAVVRAGLRKGRADEKHKYQH
jgi:hypothetical protein